MPIIIPHAVRRQKLSAALVNPKAFATTLITIAIDEFGTEMLEWHPATILLELRDTFGIELPRANFDRLMAACHLLTSDAFFKSPPTFVEISNVLSGGLYDPSTWEPADALECSWAITEAMLLVEPDDEEPFSESIRAYIGKVLDEEGILNAPDVLRIAIRDSNQAARVLSQYDDPEIQAAITQKEAAKVQEINDRIKSNLRMLIGQLTAIDLAHGDARALAGRLAHTLGAE